MFGLISVFAFGEHFMALLLARSLQGIASACISVSGKTICDARYCYLKPRDVIENFNHDLLTFKNIYSVIRME
jgi:hypothetical protein